MPTNDAVAQVRDAETRRYAAMVANDAKALDALLADDLVYTHSTAATETKKVFIDRLSSGLPLQGRRPARAAHPRVR